MTLISRVREGLATLPRIVHTMRRRPLPDALRRYNLSEKLVWSYIERNGEDEYTARGLAEELGADKNAMNGALLRLRDDGWVIEVRPPSGRRAGIYRAVSKPAQRAPENDQD